MTLKQRKKFEKMAIWIIFLGYMLILFYLVFAAPEYGRQISRKSYNLVPLKTIRNYLKYRSIVGNQVFYTNIWGNIVVFMPFGGLWTFLHEKRFIRSLCHTFLMALGVTVFIELAQYAFSVGSLDIDDVLLNVIGALIGWSIYWIYRLIVTLKKHSKKRRG